VRYFAFLHRSPGSSYGVSFPDLPGCYSGGETEAEARANAPEALAAHVQALRDLGRAVPAPSDLATAMSRVADPAAVVFTVEL